MNNRKLLTQEEVISLFEDEYGFVEGKFKIHNLPLMKYYENSDISVNSPGVYVHWRSDLGVIKVGKSQANSKKRALEHIRDNTKNDAFEMKQLEYDEAARLILFNIIDNNDIHWLLSLEAFMDWNSSPLIPSGRIG